MKKESGCLWRPVVGVLAIGVLAFGLSLQGAALHEGSVVSPKQATAGSPLDGTVATADASREPGGKVTSPAATGLYGEAMLVVEYPGVESEGGLRADDCTPRPFLGGDDCSDVSTAGGPTTLDPRSCTTSGAPCIFDSDCPLTNDVCDTKNIEYLSGDVSYATRIGQCSTTGLPCGRDLDCNEGTCSVATTQGCHTDLDCPPTETCIGGETCDNLPCSYSPEWRCTFETGDTTITFGCETDDDCEEPRTCVHGDYGWWEGFVVEECVNVAVSYCCAGPQWVYGALFDPAGCVACTSSESDDFTDFELCEDGHRTFYYYGVSPGTYYQPIYAAGDPGLDGTAFQLRLDAELALGACCTGALMDTCVPNVSPCWCDAQSPGAYLGDATTCGGDPCGTPGACCLTNGVGCVVVTGGECVTSNGSFAGPGTDCEEACCPVTQTGADDCADVTPKVVPVPGYATFVGDATGSTADCSIDPATGSWWDAFTIDECAEVMVDYCCTESGYGTVWWVMVDDDASTNCCDGSTIMRDEYSVWGAGGTLENCDDGNFRMLFHELGPGTYYLIVHEAMEGEYTLHVTTTELDPGALGACCVGPACTPGTCLSECNAMGGTWLGGGSDCGPPNPCATGACCNSNGSCDNTTSNGCVGPNQMHHPGIPCSGFRCPIWGADDCADAQLIDDCDGVVKQGYNGHATTRYGSCSTSGAVCYSTDGRTADHSTCPLPNDVCGRDAFGDPMYSCFWGTGTAMGQNTVWYKFVASETSIYAATCNSGVEDPQIYDTALVLYGGTCGALTELADPSADFDGCGEDECPVDVQGDPDAPWFSEICYCNLTVDATYYLEVINALGTPGQFQLDIECPCIQCRPGACCEVLPDRCFDYDEPDPEGNYVPVNTNGCTVSSDCNGTTNCPSPGDCICLPYFKCSDPVEAGDCPTEEDAISYRYGGNGTSCDLNPPYTQIDPECGAGLCCYGNDCYSDENPLLCLGYIGQGDTWGGEGSNCISAGSGWECPAACGVEYDGGNGHPNDSGTVYLSDTTSNGICQIGGTWCDEDADCTVGGDTCLTEGEQVMADSFVPLEAGPITELCWWGIYWEDDQVTDCSPGPALNNTTFDIRFFTDADCDGAPDLPAIATYPDLVVDKSSAGFWANEAAGLYEWEFHTDDISVTVTPGDCYFVEIVATNSTPGCDFWIETSSVGDGVGAVDNDADGIYDGAATNDLAWLMDITVKSDDCRTANDDCADVIAFAMLNTNGVDTSGFGVYQGYDEPYCSTYASTDGPAHLRATCGVSGLGSWTAQNDIWYYYTAECAGDLTVDICDSDFDTGLVVYNLQSDPWSCPTDSTDMIGCNNNGGHCSIDTDFPCGKAKDCPAWPSETCIFDCGTNLLSSRLEDLPVAQGDKILIRVAGVATTDAGTGQLKVTLDADGCLDDSDCPDDGLFCNGDEYCNVAACECAHTGDPCEAPTPYCVEGVGCVECTLDEHCTPPDECINNVCTSGAAPPCDIVGMESCMTHSTPCDDMCLAIGCDGGSAPYDNVEPRLQLGAPPTLVLDLGTCGCDAGEASVAVSCTPNAYGGTGTVNCDGGSNPTVTFSGVLPDESCCTLTFTGDIVDARTIVMLEGDVDRDCFVTTADGSSITGRLGLDPQVMGCQYDPDRDCFITTADGSSVTGRLGNLAPCPCPCP